MKVLLIHPRLARLGGLESRLLNYTDYFLERGAEVHIACRKANIEAVKPGVVVHKFSRLFASQKKKNFYFNQKLENWEKPFFDFELSLGRTTIQKNILAPASHLGYMHALKKKELTDDDELQIEMDKNGYATSQNIFACSKMVQQELIDLYEVEAKKVHVLYPPFNKANHQRFSQEEKKSIRDKYNLDPNKIYHLLVSVSHERKGLPLLIKVFEQLKDTNHSLLVIGHPVQVGLPNVTSLGFFKDPRMAYALGDYLLHPAIYEPYGQIVNEAIHHQIPVIVSKNTGAGEIIQPEYGSVVPDFDLESWLDLIKTLPQRSFYIPPTLMQDLGMDLETHMKRMLTIDGLKIE